MFLVPLLNTVQQLPQFLASKCADLTPYLGGDAVKDYPNLANIPTLPWRSTVYNGSIFGVPTTISAMNTATFVNANLWSAAGAGDPKSGDDFKKILQELTKAPAGQYGIGSAGAPGAATRSFFQGMFGSPNNWKLGTDGKLTKDYELDSSKAAVGYVRDLVSAGVWHPDSATFNLINGQSNFIAGKMATWGTGWPNYPIMWEQGLGQKPQVKIHALKPFGADGGKGTHYLGAAFYGMMALKKAPDARIKELLRILNWLAAPFGSQESQLIDYGVKDTDFTYDDKGNPVLTAKGKQDTLVSWNEIGGRPPVLFDPNSPEFAQTAHADETALVPLGVLDPTIGFYSETNQAKGASINSTLSSGIADIVTGRRPMSDYDQLVKDWRNAGGDQIRSELEKAMAAAKK
jgi:putative aldouronate transport system substrate-binding protein